MDESANEDSAVGGKLDAMDEEDDGRSQGSVMGGKSRSISGSGR